MDNSIEYNQHLQHFRAQFFKDFFIVNKTTPSDEEFKNVFLKYATTLNTDIANTHLAKARMKSKTYAELMENMPSLYWKTVEGEAELKELNLKTVSSVVNKIVDAGKNGPLHQETLTKAWKEVIEVIMLNTLNNPNSYNDALSRFNEKLLELLTQEGNSEVKLQLVGSTAYRDAVKDIVEKAKSSLNQPALSNVCKDLVAVNESVSQNNLQYLSVNQ